MDQHPIWMGREGGGGLITLLVTQQTSITSEQSGLFNRPSIKYEEWNINYCGILVQMPHNLLLREKKSKQQKVKQVDAVQGKNHMMKTMTTNHVY